MKSRVLFLLVALAFLFASPAVAEEKLNINSATAEELAASPCIGPELAKQIVEHREDVGDFASADELKDVEGIDDAKAAEIEKSFEIKGVASADCNC